MVRRCFTTDTQIKQDRNQIKTCHATTHHFKISVASFGYNNAHRSKSITPPPVMARCVKKCDVKKAKLSKRKSVVKNKKQTVSKKRCQKGQVVNTQHMLPTMHYQRTTAARAHHPLRHRLQVLFVRQQSPRQPCGVQHPQERSRRGMVGGGSSFLSPFRHRCKRRGGGRGGGELGNVVGFSCRGCFFVLLVLPGMKQCVAGLDELLCFGLVGRMPVPMDRTPTKTTCTTTCNTTSRTEQTEQTEQQRESKRGISVMHCPITRSPHHTYSSMRFASVST